MRYEDASHTGAFQGQGPIANDDTDQLAAGAKSTATGNLITGEGTQTGSAGADIAAGGQVTAIAGKGGEDSSFAGGKLSVLGEYGKLSVDAEGNYVYQANKGVENVRDRFTYTLADNQGASDTASLIVEIGKTPLVIQANAQQIVVGPDGVVTLPAGVELSDIHIVGRNLVVDMPDGTQLIIIDGAVFVPQLVLGGVEVPATNVAALLVGQEIQPAAGENTPSSGGNFAVPPPPLDPGVPLGDLIPPTEYIYIPPEPQDVFDILDRDPEAGAAAAVLDDDAQAGGNPGGVGDDPGTNVANGSLPGSEGDGSLEWALLASGTLPAGFSFAAQPNGDMWILQGGVHVLTITVNEDTGAYTVTQIAAIDHPAGGDENNLIFVINYSVTDDDGDTAIGTLTVNVDDDTPITTQVSVGGTVDEDGVPNGIPGGPGDVAGANTVVNGSVVGLFSVGADTPATYGLSSNTSGLPALTSNGVQVTYSVVGNTLTASAGGNTVFTLVVNANGTYTFTLVDQLDHPTLNGQAGDNTENDLSLALGSVIQITDGDGDSLTAPASGLVIVVDDDTPVALEGTSGGTVDEDGVPGGIAGGVGDVAGAATVANGSIAALFASGADAPLSFGLLSDTSGLPALTSNGVAVTYSVVGNTLTASAGGTPVFTLVLNANGSWTFTLLDQLDHADGLDENDLTLDFSSILQATDADGDSVGANPRALVITVDDDTPAPSGNTSTGTVDEDGVPGGIAGGPGDVAGESAVATGNASALFNSGADAPLVFAMSADTSGLPALTSNGVAVTYSVVGNTLTASAGGSPVFTFVLNANGSWTFTLLDQLDHPTLNGLAGDNTENDLAIDLSSIVLAVDADEDPISAGENALVITVDDDTPTASGNQVTGTVDEDGVPSGIAGGPGDVAGEATVANGSVATLFNSGADQPLTYSLLTNTSGLPALTSNGVAVTYAVVGNTLTASAGATDIFTFVLNANGTWTFTLLDQLDHPTLNGLAGDNTENDLGIDLSSIISATDADGDSVNANAAGLVITVDDDTPGQNATVGTVQVDEDNLTGGNLGGPNDGPGNTAGPVNFNISTLFAGGADQPMSISMSTDTSGLPALTSNGVAVTYAVVGNTLTASAGGTPVFTVVLNPATGVASFTLLDQLDHPTLNGLAGDNTENNLILDLSSLFLGTDADGDSIPLDAGSYLVDVDDDTPVASTNQISGTVDEDGVLEGAANNGPGDGIAGGVGDVAGEATVANGNVSALFNAGADQPLTYSLLTNTSGLPALTSGGVAVVYSVVGNTLTATAGPGGNVVFTFTLDGTTGAYTFTLVDQLDHAAGNNENNLSIQLGSIIQATDADGDSVTANSGVEEGLVISVDDDTPIATGAQVTGTVDEDGVLEGAADSGDGDGIAGGTGDVAGEATVATGSVSTLFQSGADEPLTFSLSAVVTALTAQGLTSNGVALSYAVVGNTLTATAPGGNTIFTFVLQTNGDWTFTLVDQLDHPTLNGLPGDDTENDLAINLSSIIQATDFDGDTVAAGANGLVITVDDDLPVARNDTDAILAGGDIATGNVITGVDTTSGVSGADSTGADQPAQVTGLASNGIPANVDNDPAGGGFVVTGLHGVLTMQADGSYSYDRADGAPGNVQDVFTYRYTDRDGDTVTATLTITIQDSAPVLLAPPPALLDDDDSLNPNVGNPGGTGDDDPANTSGSLAGLVSGGDGDIDFFFSGVQPVLPAGFTHNLVNSTTMQILQGGTVVFTITLNNESGAYSIVQNNPVDHASLDGLAGDNTENNLGPLNVGLVAIDENGTGDVSNVVNLSITADDDTPTATATQLTGTVDEDGVLEGGADNGPGDGIAGGTGDVGGAAVSATGSVATLFNPGEDQPLTYQLVNAAALNALGLTSNGVALSYSIGFAAGVYTLTAVAPGGNTIFTFTLNESTGAYNFTLVDQLDHPTLNGGAGDNEENDLAINLSAIIQATDFDGDSVLAGASGLIITVDDDTPIATAAQLTGTVDEDGVIENAAVGTQEGDGVAAGTGDVAGEAVTSSGSFATLFQSGADEALTYQLVNAAGLNALGLTSGGVALSYSIGFAAGVYTLTASAPGGNTIFTLTLTESTGAYTFTLVDQLDHLSLNGLAGDDTENDLAINLSAIIQATDRDGDTVAAGANALVITVDDDTSTLAFGPHNPVTTKTATGTMTLNSGADQWSPATLVDTIINVTANGGTVGTTPVALTNFVVNPVPTANTNALVTYSFSFSYDSDPLAPGVQNANATGSITINKATGQYSITLDQSIGYSSTVQTGNLPDEAFVTYEDEDFDNFSQEEVTVAELTPTFFVQFSGLHNGFGYSGTDASGNLFTGTPSYVSASNDSNGVASDTIAQNDVLNLNFYTQDPGGDTTAPTDPKAFAEGFFIEIDHWGGEDMVFVLKLADPANPGVIITRTFIANADDFFDIGTGTPAGYNFTFDQDDAVLVVEANDYRFPGDPANLSIVGIQLVSSTQDAAGAGYNFVGATGAGGGIVNQTETAFSAATDDNEVFKIVNIGFKLTTATPQPVTLNFNVNATDFDGDTTANVPLSVTFPASVMTPVVLDMDGDGAEFLDRSAGVAYDYDGDGVKEATGWAGPDDGILVRDANANGTVDNASEFVFGSNGVTDLQALAAQYGSTLDANDADFSKFGVWQDANSNGAVDAGEFASLTSLGITSLDLVSDGQAYSAAGGDVEVAGSASYTNADGSTGVLADVSFITGGSYEEQRALNNSSSSIAIAAAVAAAGLANAQAAAAPADDQDGQADLNSAAAGSSQTGAPAVADDSDASRSALANETVEAANDDAPASSSASTAADESSHSLDDGNASAAASSDDASAANDDDGPATADPQVAPVASVAMASAEQLQAAALEGNAQHNSVVEKIIVEALGGGAATVDALLNAIHGGNDDGPQVAILASPTIADVSTWDMASNGGSAGDYAMLMKVGAEVLHHDMVQPTQNG